MRNTTTVLAVLTVALLSALFSGCYRSHLATEATLACEESPPLFPYPYDATRELAPGEPNAIPMCPGEMATYGCETFEDFNGDGLRDFEDISDFCESVWGDRGFARDEITPFTEDGIRTDYCWSCS